MKKNYKELLKESILKEFDTSKNVDVKGPMLDAILSYSGSGELPTHQDASSILERYYYGEKMDKGVEIHEAEKIENEISEVPKDSIEATKNDIEDEVGGDETADKRELGGDAIEEDIEIENTVIEKLIAEMDDDGEKKDEDEDDDKGDEGKELDVDKKLNETPLPGFKTSTGYRSGTGGNVSTDLEEAFQLFQEQIEDEDDDEDEEDEKKEENLKEAEEKDEDDDEDEDEDDEDLEECKYMK
jgi:hypothetical protein